MPVLTGILVRAEKGSLILAATDLEIGAEVRIPAEVYDPGAVVLPARYLVELSRRIPEGILLWEAQDGTAGRLRWGRSEFVLRGFSAADFPAFPSFPERMDPFPKARLREALRQTVFAAASDPSRPVLTGVELVYRGSQFRALATDGLRVAHHRSTPGEEGWEGSERLLVPARALEELLRCLGDDDGEGYWAKEANHLLVQLGDLRLAARLLEGHYPAVLELLPKEYGTMILTDREAFQSACERVSLVSSDAPDRLHAVTVAVSPGSVVLSAETPDVGEAREEIPAEARGAPVTAVFNAKLLLEGLRHFAASDLTIELAGPAAPARIRDASGRQEYFQLPITLR